MASFIVGYIFLILGNIFSLYIFFTDLSLIFGLIFQDFIAYILFAVGFNSLAKKYPVFRNAKILSHVLAAVSTVAFLVSFVISSDIIDIIIGFIMSCVFYGRICLMYMAVKAITNLDTDISNPLGSRNIDTWWFFACVLYGFSLASYILVLLGADLLSWVYIGFYDFALIASCVFACYLNKALSLLIKV